MDQETPKKHDYVSKVDLSGKAADEPVGIDDLPEITVEELPEKLKEGIDRAGWPQMMEVQKRSIPYQLAGRDIMVQSRTGSGKTGAFVLPLLDMIDPERAECQALILTPTRELAKQVGGEAEMLSGGTIRTIAVYGGVGYGPQLEAFREGAHLVVGTPGRVLDHLMRKSLKLNKIRFLVFDEADRMLSMGFYPDMRKIQGYLPEKQYQASMFSATFPPFVVRLANEFLRDPVMLSLSKDNVHVATTEHVYYSVPYMDKDRCLVRILEIENPDVAIIFCNTKDKVHYVAVVLQRFGYDADEISSDLSQKAREKVLGKVRSGTLRFLVATDVAARGIDVPEISHVIQYEPPDDQEAYIHRSGRTGRAGASGEAITLVSGTESLKLRNIAKMYKMDLIERKPPTEEEVAEIVAERATALLEARRREMDEEHKRRIRPYMDLADKLNQDEERRELLAMLLDDFYVAAVTSQQRETTEEEMEPVPEEVAVKALEARKRERDKLKLERMRRFIPLAQALDESEEERELLAMLIDDFFREQRARELEEPRRPAPSERREERPRRPSRDSESRGGDGGGGRPRRKRRRR